MSEPEPLCPKCQTDVCAPNQRLCRGCRAEWKRDARRKASMERGTGRGEQAGNGGESPGEQPEREIGEPSATSRKRPPGPRLPENWLAEFLSALRGHGARIYTAARVVGIHPSTIFRHQAADPAFAQALRDAREEHADTLEGEIEDMGRKTNNPVSHIVRLKALRPGQYIERSIALTADLTPKVSNEEAKALLAQMLAVATAATLAELARASEEATRSSEGGDLESKALPPEQLDPPGTEAGSP
jgi:hypothetical protein